jgi:hypothetical protein
MGEYVTGHVSTTSIIHERIHQGLYFSHDEAEPALGSSGALDLLIITDAAAGVHMKLGGSVGDTSRLQLFEGTTVSANGTARTPFNRNRISTVTPLTSVFFAPTITGVGTLLEDKVIPANLHISENAADLEWVLPPGGSLYLARLTNLAGSASAATLSLGFYEIDNPDLLI